MSPLPDQEAWNRDAFSLHWEGLNLSAFPPFALIPHVLVRIRDFQHVQIMLVAPL